MRVIPTTNANEYEVGLEFDESDVTDSDPGSAEFGTTKLLSLDIPLVVIGSTWASFVSDNSAGFTDDPDAVFDPPDMVQLDASAFRPGGIFASGILVDAAGGEFVPLGTLTTNGGETDIQIALNGTYGFLVLSSDDLDEGGDPTEVPGVIQPARGASAILPEPPLLLLLGLAALASRRRLRAN